MLPTFANVQKANSRIAGYALQTPVIESPQLNARTGGRVLIKLENLQRTGSFKFRGAWNRISQLDPATAGGGVVAYSSGNHAQGVAAAAQIRGLRAAIVMPADTPEMKKVNTQSYGAEVITYDRARESREEIAARIAEERGAVLVPPFDDPDIIAGQGTVGLEFVQEAKRRGVVLDDVLTGCSGGGLAAGIALSFEALSPVTMVHTVEPEHFDDMARSLRSGQRESNERKDGSICDALLSPSPGVLTFEINRKRLGEGLVVSEAQVKEAVRYAFEALKVVAEPGGAVGLAAVLAGHVPTKGRNTGVVISGGNIDAALFCRISAEGN